MAAVPLNYHHIPRPTVMGDNPSDGPKPTNANGPVLLQDLTNARLYAHKIGKDQAAGLELGDDLGHAVAYEHSIASQFGPAAVAPPWAAGLQTSLDNLTTKVDNLTTKVDNLTTKVDNLTTKVTQMDISLSLQPALRVGTPGQLPLRSAKTYCRGYGLAFTDEDDVGILRSKIMAHICIMY
ncbi:hypothetical protein MNV49_002128 [Pseudohyphozyma bogoriensis]|nr:hypothetical protein MNV49_002128 [Pseudohyphozyma bogoriensis]